MAGKCVGRIAIALRDHQIRTLLVEELRHERPIRAVANDYPVKSRVSCAGRIALDADASLRRELREQGTVAAAQIDDRAERAGGCAKQGGVRRVLGFARAKSIIPWILRACQPYWHGF